MKKRILSSLLALCMVFALLPSSALAATAITKIRITIDAPATGKLPAATATVPSTANSTVEKVEWSGALDTDGTFMPRTTYKVTVTMGIKPGSNHIFSDKTINATVNGKKADEVLWYAEDKVTVSYTFPQFGTGSILTMAHITLEAPAVGEKPAATAKLPSTASTYVKRLEWTGALDSSGCFQAGTEYTAIITLAVKDGLDRKFSTKTFDATVNGVVIDAATLTRVSDKELIIPVEFEKTAAPADGTAAPGGASTGETVFTDVPEDAYFAAPVAWAVNNKITSGKTATAFAPNDTCTQAQILTFLWRATGSPEPEGTVEMEGFEGTEYYYQAAMWAAEREMVGGEFDPDAPCTRAMAVTFMWNYAGSPSAASAGFTDVSANADYVQAVAWAVEKGVTSGTGGNQFSPAQTCTRGQIVTFLYRAFAN